MPLVRALTTLLSLLLPTSALAQAAAAAATLPPDQLDGRAIYERVVANRYESFTQHTTLVSGDRTGNEQSSRLDMSYQAFRDDQGAPLDGVIVSKTLVRYTHPFDLRHTGYLVIQNQERPNDQFVYRASNRRIQRVILCVPALGADLVKPEGQYTLGGAHLFLLCHPDLILPRNYIARGITGTQITNSDRF